MIKVLKIFFGFFSFFFHNYTGKTKTNILSRVFHTKESDQLEMSGHGLPKTDGERVTGVNQNLRNLVENRDTLFPKEKNNGKTQKCANEDSLDMDQFKEMLERDDLITQKEIDKLEENSSKYEIFFFLMIGVLFHFSLLKTYYLDTKLSGNREKNIWVLILTLTTKTNPK